MRDLPKFHIETETLKKALNKKAAEPVAKEEKKDTPVTPEPIKEPPKNIETKK
jgi:hypothetical protein